MDQKIYYAKSKRQDGSQPTVAEHLDAVAECAAMYGNDIGMREQARIAGLSHDLGKCGERFQAVLRGETQNIDHAASSAAILYRICGKSPHEAQRAVIEAVNGHHDGLKGFETVKELLKDSLLGRPYLTTGEGKTPSLNGTEEYQNAVSYFLKTHPNEQMRISKWDFPKGMENLESMLCTRMLFSCLVDADYSVSAWEDDKTYFEFTRAPELDAAAGLDALYTYCDKIRRKSKANLVKVEKKADIAYPRSYHDYTATVDMEHIPAGVEIGFQTDAFSEIVWNQLPAGEKWFTHG